MLITIHMNGWPTQQCANLSLKRSQRHRVLPASPRTSVCIHSVSPWTKELSTLRTPVKKHHITMTAIILTHPINTLIMPLPLIASMLRPHHYLGCDFVWLAEVKERVRKQEVGRIHQPRLHPLQLSISHKVQNLNRNILKTSTGLHVHFTQTHRTHTKIYINTNTNTHINTHTNPDTYQHKHT